MRGWRVVGEALAGAAEDHPVAPRQLQLQLLHQQAQHLDLGVARLHHLAQILDESGAKDLIFGAEDIDGHNTTVPSAA